MADPLMAYVGARASTKSQPKNDRPSLLRQIAGKVMSPLAAVGNLLDLPGSSVRDVLTGQNPFDQYATPFRDENRTTGRDVLSQYGLTTPNDPNRWEWSDVGGFLGEVALDPLTYMSGGLSGVGKALRGTGKATHLAKIGLPFTRMEVPVGKGAAQLLDKAAGKAWATKIPMSGGKTFGDVGDAVNLARNGLFDYASNNAFDKVGQGFNKRRTGLADDMAPDAFMESKALHDEMLPIQDEFLKSNSGLPAEDATKLWDRVLTHTQELAGRAGDHQGAFSKAYQEIVGSPAPANLVAQAEKPLQSWAGSLRKTINAEREWGGKIGVHDHEFTSYSPRAASKELLDSQDKAVNSGGLFSHENSAGREDILANVPQEYLRKMLNDTSLNGASKYIGNNPLGGGAQIENDFGKFLGYETTDPTTFKKIQVTPKEHAAQLAEYLGSLDPSIKSIHEIAPAGLLERRKAGSVRVIANMKATHETFSDAIKAGPTGKTTRLEDAYKQVGMDPERAVQKYADLHGITVDEAKQLRVDQAIVDAIAGVNQFSGQPKWLEFLGSGIDQFNSMFKSNVTMPFPTFHIRNWVSGQHMNVASGHVKTPKDLMRYMSAYKKALSLREAGSADPMIREAMAHGVLGSKQAFEDVTLRGTSDIGPGIKNSPVKGYKDAVDFVADPANANPLLDAIPGGKAMRTGYNTVMNTGSNIAQTAEYYNRMPMYVYLREQGMSPAKAAKEVEKLHFDYSKLSPFERGVMRRLVPFYSFNRKITPQILATLAENPGGGIGQTIRASTAGRDPEDVMAPQIANTAAVPLGTKPDGTKSYLTDFGLAPEAAMPYLAAPIDPKGALLNFAASTTPLVKMPLEMATGQTFFQRGPNGGRPLNDLDPTIGRTISNIGEQLGLREPGGGPVNILGDRGASRIAEHLASNSPISRLLTQARTLTDPRKNITEKSANLLSPVKLTDISPKAQERSLIDASNALADSLGAGSWSNRYFREEDLKRMDKYNPAMAAQARALKKLWDEAKKTARKEKGKTKKARSDKKPERAGNPLIKAAGL